MSHPTFPPALTGIRLVSRVSLMPMVALALATACSEPLTPPDARQLQPRSIIVNHKSPQVFNVQLRSVEDPNIIDDPNIRPHGHIQFKLYGNDDGTFTLAWKGEIFNAGGESFTGWSMSGLDSGRPSLFVAFGEVDGINDRLIDPEDATIISGELATAFFGDRRGIPPKELLDPGDRIRVVFFTTERPAGAIAGTF